jgi:hypothetical protein
MSTLQKQIVGSLIEFVFQESADPSLAPLRERQYRRLIGNWAGHPALADHLKVIDDPQHFYVNETLESVFANEEPDTNAVSESIAMLRQWHVRYPELTGPARTLALLLTRGRKDDEAMTILSRAIQQGFYRPGVVTCYSQRMEIWYGRAAAASHKQDIVETKRCLENVRQDAQFVKTNSQDEKEVKHAMERLEEINNILGL